MEENTDLTPLVKEILRDSREMVLATSEDDIPWTSVLVFGHDENFNLYWLSDEKARHSQELEKNSNVAAAITKMPTGGGQDKGLQIQGKARKLNEEEILGAAREYFAKRGTDHMPESLEEANKLAKGRSWYVLEPTKIDIIYGPLFGYEHRQYTP